jgi:hypothetical protein
MGRGSGRGKRAWRRGSCIAIQTCQAAGFGRLFVGTNDLSVNKGISDEVELTDHGSILEIRDCFLLCARDHCGCLLRPRSTGSGAGSPGLHRRRSNGSGERDTSRMNRLQQYCQRPLSHRKMLCQVKNRPRQKRSPGALGQSCQTTIRKTRSVDQVHHPARARHAGVQWSIGSVCALAKVV